MPLSTIFKFYWWRIPEYTEKTTNLPQVQGLENPLARCPWLVISTFGLAEIISCMPDGLVKIYIGYWQTCQYLHIYLYSYTVCYMLFNQQQCFIYSTASFLSKLKAKKVKTASTNDGLPEILKMKYRNRIPETTISGFADSKKKKKKN